MGQVNRVDSARLAVARAGEERARGAVAASDAFFPFPDGLEVLLDGGVRAVVQPGGSVRDAEVIAAARGRRRHDVPHGHAALLPLTRVPRAASPALGMAGRRVREAAVASRQIPVVRELAGRYDAVLCDVWGVLPRRRATVFPGARPTRSSRAARAPGVRVVLLTNMPRPSSTMPAALARLGFPDDAWDAIVTSGDAIRGELARRAPGPVLRLGRDTDRGAVGRAGAAVRRGPRPGAVPGHRRAARRATRAPSDYAAVLRAARDRDLELLCANPDLQIMSGGELRWCAGSVAEAYAALGGRVVQAGKPHAAIYERAFEVLARSPAGPSRASGSWRSATARPPTCWAPTGRGWTACSSRPGSTGTRCSTATRWTCRRGAADAGSATYAMPRLR